MLNIKFKGKFKDEWQIRNGKKLPRKAVMIKKTDLSKVKAVSILLPIAMLVLGMWVLQKQNAVIKLKVDVAFGIAFVATLVLAKLLTYVYVIIHALFYPAQAVKEIWVEPKRSTKFVSCNAKVSKVRFITICLAPVMILGIIPYVIWLIAAHNMPNYLSICSLILICMMMLLSAEDLLKTYNAAVTVPKNADIISYGLESYWIEVK